MTITRCRFLSLALQREEPAKSLDQTRTMDCMTPMKRQRTSSHGPLRLGSRRYSAPATPRTQGANHPKPTTFNVYFAMWMNYNDEYIYYWSCLGPLKQVKSFSAILILRESCKIYTHVCVNLIVKLCGYFCQYVRGSVSGCNLRYSDLNKVIVTIGQNYKLVNYVQVIWRIDVNKFIFITL